MNECYGLLLLFDQACPAAAARHVLMLLQLLPQITRHGHQQANAGMNAEAY